MTVTFESLGLRPELVQAVLELGYEKPSPIQVDAIPALIEGQDIIGQAQTGTGKTAAFALPMLHKLNTRARGVQALVLTPTRELALQVSEAIYNYGKTINARVAPIYGGASYTRQIKRLQEGVQVVVGTPGRMIDLIERGVLDLSGVGYLVLDEADEMLKMGFVDDVELILSKTPSDRQTALFSATMPTPIRRLADRYMHNPTHITIAAKALTVPQIEQRYYMVREESKLAALSRLIEVEEVNSALIFARTKVRTTELAEAMLARGFQTEALNGDMSQEARETVLRRFRNGQLTFLVATDVVARGVDIPSVSHVFNFDVPHDAEDYVHRIGRTGRAGREGVAIMLITPRESRWLRTIEDYSRQRITRATLPTADAVLTRRDERFTAALSQQLEGETLDREMKLVNQMVTDGFDLQEVAAAAIRMARANERQRPVEEVKDVFASDRSDRPREGVQQGGDRRDRRSQGVETGMVRLMMDVGHEHGIRPGDVVGAIASEAGIPGKSIGAIDIQRSRTFVDVKDTHAEKVLRQMSRSTMRGRPVTLTRAGAADHAARPNGGSGFARRPRANRNVEQA